MAGFIAGALANDCGAIHRDDAYREPLPPPLRFRQRAREVEEREKQAAAAEDWPIIPSLTLEQIDSRLATQEALTPPASPNGSRDETIVHEILDRAQPPWGRDRRESDELEREYRHRWYRHSGQSSRSDQGTLRHAAATLFPHAAPPRAGDDPDPVPGPVIDFITRQVRCAQDWLTPIGLHTLTLYRAYSHEINPWRTPLPPRLEQLLQRGLDVGALRETETAEGTRIMGQIEDEAIVSTLDGWATARKLGEGWRFLGTAAFRGLMVAEVPAWAIASWSKIGLGDSDPPGRSQEVVVLGGRGRVRWEIDAPVTWQMPW